MARTHSLLSRFAAAFALGFGSGRFSFQVLHGAYFSPFESLKSSQLFCGVMCEHR